MPQQSQVVCSPHITVPIFNIAPGYPALFSCQQKDFYHCGSRRLSLELISLAKFPKERRLEKATDFLDLCWYFCGSQAISSPLKALVSGHILTIVKSSNNSEDNQGLVTTLPYNKANVQHGQAVAFDECQVFFLGFVNNIQNKESSGFQCMLYPSRLATQDAHPKITFAPKLGRWTPKSFQCQKRTAFHLIDLGC